MKKLPFIIIAAALTAATVALSGCSSHKENSDTTTATGTVATAPPDLTSRFDQTVANYPVWQTFVANGHLDLAAGKQLGSNVQVKMVRGKSVFISLRPMLGLEVGKLLITTDSIFITDKINKLFVAESISKFTLGLPLTINMLQDVLLNRPFSLRGGTLTAADHRNIALKKDSNGNGWSATPSDQIPGVTYSFNFNNKNRLTQLEIKPKIGKALTVDYSDFFDLPQGSLAGNVTFDASLMGTTVGFDLEYSQGSVRWNTAVNNDKDSRSTYRRISLLDYLGVIRNM